jgi:hypothetical protein
MNEMANFRGVEPTVACTDCEGAMVAAWRNLDYCGQGCFCHRLEKVSEVFFNCPGHKETMKKARKLAGHFHHSSQAIKELKDLGAAMLRDHPRGLQTIQDVATRW